MKRNTLLVVGAILLLIFAGFVWPTPYHYVHGEIYGYDRLVRVNRFTQSAAMLTPDGWRELPPKKQGL